MSCPTAGFGKPGRLSARDPGHRIQRKPVGGRDAEVPYTHDPKEPYNWVRVRMIGGKSLFWARMSFRFSDYEFKAKDHDGYGENWPISYADLAPYYDQVEPIFRVRGPQGSCSSFPTAISSKIIRGESEIEPALYRCGQGARHPEHQDAERPGPNGPSPVPSICCCRTRWLPAT